MSKKATGILLIALVLMSVGFADGQDNKKVKFVYPKEAFDKEAAKTTLEKGTATIGQNTYEVQVYNYYKISWTERVYVYEAVEIVKDDSLVKVELK